MKYKWLTAAVFLIVLAAVLLGCKKPQVLDGPGMINNQPWKGFTLSHTDGTRYYFRFVVKESDFGFLLTGECRDENGDLHVLEEGVELSADNLEKIVGGEGNKNWNVGPLPDCPKCNRCSSVKKTGNPNNPNEYKCSACGAVIVES